jgi:hypothetical protein
MDDFTQDGRLITIKLSIKLTYMINAPCDLFILRSSLNDVPFVKMHQLNR